jgi:hypothetical protein
MSLTSIKTSRINEILHEKLDLVNQYRIIQNPPGRFNENRELFYKIKRGVSIYSYYEILDYIIDEVLE